MPTDRSADRHTRPRHLVEADTDEWAALAEYAKPYGMKPSRYLREHMLWVIGRRDTPPDSPAT